MGGGFPVSSTSGKKEFMDTLTRADTIQGGTYNWHPLAMADTFWALFSGVVLWLTSKKILDEKKDYLKQTLDVAFEIFRRGLKK
jgi:glutamate-1-semialdehyde aminotransferase